MISLRYTLRNRGEKETHRLFAKLRYPSKVAFVEFLLGERPGTLIPAIGSPGLAQVRLRAAWGSPLGVKKRWTTTIARLAVLVDMRLSNGVRNSIYVPVPTFADCLRSRGLSVSDETVRNWIRAKTLPDLILPSVARELTSAWLTSYLREGSVVARVHVGS